jgi:hypothetical protein
LQTRCADEVIPYTGEQLHSLWIYRHFDLVGDSAVAFLGSCDVKPKHMRDVVDLKEGSSIRAEEMLHFIIEHFDLDLEKMVLRQCLFMTLMAEQLNRGLATRGGRCDPARPAIRREGSDLYDSERKLTVSVATLSPVSGLIHAGINISCRGTPVPTAGLDNYDIAPREFAEAMLKAYAGEMAMVHHARCKVRPCP